MRTIGCESQKEGGGLVGPIRSLLAGEIKNCSRLLLFNAEHSSFSEGCGQRIDKCSERKSGDQVAQNFQHVRLPRRIRRPCPLEEFFGASDDFVCKCQPHWNQTQSVSRQDHMTNERSALTGR